VTFGLPLDQVDAARLEALRAGGVREGRQLEYKESSRAIATTTSASSLPMSPPSPTLRGAISSSAFGTDETATASHLHPSDFEVQVANNLKDRGYEVQWTGRAGDGGVDIRATGPGGVRIVVQCKGYQEPVGPASVRELYGTLMHERAHEGWLVALAGFSGAAKEFAAGKPLRLLDVDTLIRHSGLFGPSPAN
jgi:restriction endonuclease Mrr